MGNHEKDFVCQYENRSNCGNCKHYQIGRGGPNSFLQPYYSQYLTEKDHKIIAEVVESIKQWPKWKREFLERESKEECRRRHGKCN